MLRISAIFSTGIRAKYPINLLVSFNVQNSLPSNLSFFLRTLAVENISKGNSSFYHLTFLQSNHHPYNFTPMATFLYGYIFECNMLLIKKFQKLKSKFQKENSLFIATHV